MSSVTFTPVTYPPLGSTTAVHKNNNGTVSFRALIITSEPDGEVGVVRPAERFSVCLWWSVDGRGVWRAAIFNEVNDHDKSENLVEFVRSIGPHEKLSKRRDLFKLELPYTGNTPLVFALKYRFSDGPWLWEGARIGTNDGRVVFIPESPNLELETGFPQLCSRGWNVVNSQLYSGVRTYHIKTRCALNSLGIPTSLERYMAVIKIATPWMGPIHGGRVFECLKDAVMVLLQRRDGTVLMVLPVSGIAGRGTGYVVSDEIGNGEVVVRFLDDHSSPETAVNDVIVAIGENVDDVVDAGMSYLKSLLPPPPPSSPLLQNQYNQRPEVVSGLTHWETGLSYCTWNGLGWDLSEDRILDALQKLDDHAIRVCNVVIDDNWQSLEGHDSSCGTWSRFEADVEKFPHGLVGTVNTIRTRFPYIKHVGVWHALHGYWDGITPNSEIANKYRTVKCWWRSNVNGIEKQLELIHPDDVERFYDDFYKFLSQSGVDCVKTDVQCRIDELMYGADKALLWKAYQDALTKGAKKYFQGKVIYCMSHTPNILYHTLLGESGKKLFRTSDDFYPSIPKSHAWHVFANAMNMTLFSHLNILPDWDMFQTSLPIYGQMHAAARALSGGPIFITDTPGHHDLGLLSKMCGLFLGSSNPGMMTMQPSGIAKATDPFIAFTAKRLLCIRNHHEYRAEILGVFNISDSALVELIPKSLLLSSFPNNNIDNTVETGNVLMSFNATAGTVKRVSSSQKEWWLVVDLQPGEWEVYTTVRMEPGAGMCVIGIEGAICGVAGVGKVNVNLDQSNRVTAVIEMIVKRTLVLYVENLKTRKTKVYFIAGDVRIDASEYLLLDRYDNGHGLLRINVEHALANTIFDSNVNCFVEIFLDPKFSHDIE